MSYNPPEHVVAACDDRIEVHCDFCGARNPPPPFDLHGSVYSSCCKTKIDPCCGGAPQR